MSTAAVTNTFSAGTTAVASQVNTNFSDLVSYINTNCIVKDGTLATTAVLSGPSTDPTSDNHYSRKAYVDGLVGRSSGYATGSHTITAAGGFQSIMITTITDPGKAVVVEAWGSFTQGTGSGGRFIARLGISFDGGATYTYSTQQNITTSASGFAAFSPCFRKAGTPTGDIKITLDHEQVTAGTLGAATEAHIMYDMFKTVAI